MGISSDLVDRARVLVDFGHGNRINMLESHTCKAPAVWGCLGSSVYSLIDHAHIRRGDRGITGTSTDPAHRDRVAVQFGFDPRSFNLHADMVALNPPAREQQRTSSAFQRNDHKESLPLLRTEDVTLISHTHGRARRMERNIMRRELQAAIKHGVKERANPGRDGSTRWRYTYDGVVYITDESSRHEVTCWRIDGKDAEAVAPAEIELAGKGCHAVLIVDSSGSMRSPDVPGYKTRAKAVYDCLIRDFVEEQVKNGSTDDVVVTLISMSDDATVLMETQPLDHSLVAKLEKIGRRYPRSHGNYIPALDKALEVMTADAPNRSSLLLLFFSDGAPSDQHNMECEHGCHVFQIDREEDPFMGHRTRASALACRRRLHNKVKRECIDRVKRIGQVFGRDKVILRMLAFGPPKEDFRLLSELADALPRGEFQKLGLDANNLKTAFSSLSSSMTELRTEGGGHLLTPRLDKVVNKQQSIDFSSVGVSGSDGWWIYSFEDFLGKYVFEGSTGELKRNKLIDGATGLAFVGQPFAEGAERFVFRCTEIAVPDYAADHFYTSWRSPLRLDKMKAFRLGLRLVAKEAKNVENLHQGRSFHERFARVQLDAAGLADQFSQELPKPQPEWKVPFLPTYIYGCHDVNYKNAEAWVLVEPELDGKFTKWNNNAGAVRDPTAAEAESAQCFGDVIRSGLGIGMSVLEESEEEEEEVSTPIELNNIPQAFSHFTYERSMGKQLVCDLQGVWNPEDGFMLTDPVVHYVCPMGKKHKNGATDKGLDGVKKFFATHKCNVLCEKMGLKSRSPHNLIRVSSNTKK